MFVTTTTCHWWPEGTTAVSSSDKGKQPPGGSGVPSGVISWVQSHSRTCSCCCCYDVSMNTSMILHSVARGLRTHLMTWPTPVWGKHPAGCAWWTLKQWNTQGLVYPSAHLMGWGPFESPQVGWTRSRPECTQTELGRLSKIIQDHHHIRAEKLQYELVFLAGGIRTRAISVSGGGASSGLGHFQDCFFCCKKTNVWI